MKRVFGHPLLMVVSAAVLIAGVFVCVFTPDLFWFKRGANFTVQIMLGYFLLGMLLFVFNQKHLMYTSLACCAALCIYLKSASNENLRLPARSEGPQLACALINLSLSEDFDVTNTTIHNTQSDVIVFQEYTPDWDDFLRGEIGKSYPYRAYLTRIDPFGMAWYSKYPIMLADTFAAADIPNLLINIELQPGTLVNLISVHTRVPSDANAYRHIRQHFHEVSQHMNALDLPVIVVGDLNLPSWTNEVMEFKLQSKLKDSRRDIVPTSMEGSFSLLKVPVDHIFFSNDLECTSFQEIDGKGESHLGIVGSYQLVTKREKAVLMEK
jgi:endonuclease/exonuclease/phosphatase (EEP) superfamily protein YafD